MEDGHYYQMKTVYLNSAIASGSRYSTFYTDECQGGPGNSETIKSIAVCNRGSSH